MTNNKLYGYTEHELLFIAALKSLARDNGLEKQLSIIKDSRKILNFHIGYVPIGRVKLNGRKYRVQVIGGWDENITFEYALSKIPEWIEYYLNYQNLNAHLINKIRGK